MKAGTGQAAANAGAPSAPRVPRHLTQHELAGHWGISERTLERWRWLRQGPAFLKIGGRVAYRMEDILSFESAQRRAPVRIADPFFRRPR